MALTKAQVSLVTVSTLGVAAGGYTAQLAAFNTQKEAAAFIATTGLLNEGTNAEFVNTVAGNLNNLASTTQKAAFYKALEDGATRADAAVDFANTVLVEKGSIANVTKATASTSTSMDLGALKAEVTPAVNAQEITFNTANGTGFAQKDLQANLGKAEIENGAGKISADFTFELKNQANVFTDDAGYITTGGAPKSTVGEFTGAFLSPMLERAGEVKSDSTIYVKLLDGFALRDNFQSIERLATNGVGFSLDGVNIVLADKAEDGANGAIYKAKNYTELKDALTARLAELAAGNGLPAGADAATYAKLATFTVESGSIFTKANQAGDQVTGTELVIKDSAGSTLVAQGFSTYGGIHPHTDLNSINELTNQAPATSTQLISTNIVAENVGYGSQGATLNVAGQSASKKGVEEFKLTATKDVWFTRLESRDTANNQHLQEVLLQTGSEGYFRVGTQDKGASLVALVDQDFGVKGGGLVDVIKLDAAAASSTAVNAFISDDVIERNYNLKDTDNNYKTDNVQVNYNLTGGDDVLQLAIASEVVAYADSQVTINTGTGGNDIVHLKIVNNALNGSDNVVNAGSSTYGSNWLKNQQLNDNIKIEAMSGNNTIWTEGSGNVRINTGGGNDVVYTDNSARDTVGNAAVQAKLTALGFGHDVNALFVANAQNTNLGDLLSNMTANNTAAPTQEFNLFKANVEVTFEGFQSLVTPVESTNFKTSAQQINQAIKKAVNDDPVLNKLIQVIEYPGNTLVVESLIDGVRSTSSLKIDVIAPAAHIANPTAAQTAALKAAGKQMLTATDLADAAKAYNPTVTNPAAIAVTDLTSAATTANGNYAVKFATDGDATGALLDGKTSTAVSDNVVNVGAGNDVIVLGTGAYSNDIIKLTGHNNGTNTIVNFSATGSSIDYLDLNYYVGATRAKVALGDAVNASGTRADKDVAKLSVTEAQFDTLTDAEMLAQLNGTAATDKQIATLKGIDATTGATDNSNYVLMVENEGNLGEHKVFHLTAASGANEGKFATAQTIATLDFGVPTDPTDPNFVTVEPVGSVAVATDAADAITFTNLETGQFTITGFNAAEDKLVLTGLTGADGATLAELAGDTIDSGVIGVQVNEIAGSTFVNLGNDADGEVISIELLGVTDASLVDVELVLI